MPHPLDERLPNDTPWATRPMTVWALRKQCAIRNLSTEGYTEELVQRLSAYSQANTNASDIKRLHPWLTEPVDRPMYQATALDAEREILRFQLARVVDKPGRKRDSLKRDFEICDSRLWPQYTLEKWKPITVSIDTVLECDCLSLSHGPCVHQIFVLRYVLNCPEPYRWQRALLPSELRTIYQYSHASRAFGPKNSETQNYFCIFRCIFCFRNIHQGSKELDHCEKCTRVMHPVCSSNAAQARTPMREGTCWICYDNIEWNLEKFCWNDRALPAAPSTAPAVPAQTGPAAGAIQENIQRKEPEDKQPNNTPSINRRLPSSLSSSSSSTNNPSSLTLKLRVPSLAHRRGQLPRESGTKALQAPRESGPLSTSAQTNESITLPGIPALIGQDTQEEREQQQQEKERQQASLPNPSAALGHALPALNPGGGDMEPSEVATAPNAARIPAGDHTSPRASSSAAQALASPAVTTTPQHIQAGTTSIPAHNPSVEGVISQTPQICDTIASATEPAAATGSQHTTSTPANNPTSVSTPVLSGHSAPVPTQAPSGTHTNIDNAKALELVQECSRLAKKSVQIRKKSEREAKRMEKKHRRELKNFANMEKKHRQELKKITKMEKKHRRELKKTKRKSKQEVKRLEKKIESLEKDVLKALARPEVAEGATV